MLLLGKLLGIVALQRSLPDATSFRQFLVGVAVTLLLIIIASFMIGGLMIAWLYGIYLLLVAYGLTHDAACVSVITVALLLTMMLLLAIYAQVHKLNTMLCRLLPHKSPVASRISEVADSFVNGLMAGTKKE